MMCDLGFQVKPLSIIDAKATTHVRQRHGIGKVKHIDEAHLWSQDEVRRTYLADIGTEALSNKITRKHATSMEYIDAQENLKSGDAMALVGKSVQADQSSPARQETSSESTGGHARQHQR